MGYRGTRGASGRRLRWAGGAAAVVAVLATGCSNQVVSRAPIIPALTPTTVAAAPAQVTKPRSLDSIISGVLASDKLSLLDLAKTPINILRTKGLANIKIKLDALNSALATLNTVTHLSAAGVSLERDELNSAIQGLTGVQSQISNEQNIGAMRSEVAQLVSFADVGTEIVPKVGVLASADTVLRTTDSLNGQINQLQARINTAAGKGKNTSAAVAALGIVRNDTGQAVSLAGGLMISVPLLTASQTSQITPDNNIVASARTAASAAQAAVGAVGAALQAVGA
jgi:hypothetical protein